MGAVAGLLTGTILGGTGLALLAPVFFQEALKNDPVIPNKPALFTEVEPGKAKVIMRGGRVIKVLRGSDKSPYINEHDPNWWKAYRRFVWNKAGLQVIIPFIERIYSYDLPRYRVVDSGTLKAKEEGKSDGRPGRLIFVPVEEGSQGYRSDHVRIQPTTWYVDIGGAEVETLAVTVKASAQVRIISGMEEDALFESDAWNVLLTQALNTVTRGVVRSSVTIDMMIGRVEEDIWAAKEPVKDADYIPIQTRILEGVRNYTITTSETDEDGNPVLDENGKEKLKPLKLADFGIDVMSFDIIDFEPELDADELKKLRSAAIAVQEARARDLKGKGEGGAKRAVAEALKEYPEFAQAQLETDALIQAAQAGNLDALLAALVRNYTKGK